MSGKTRWSAGRLRYVCWHNRTQEIERLPPSITPCNQGANVQAWQATYHVARGPKSHCSRREVRAGRGRPKVSESPRASPSHRAAQEAGGLWGQIRGAKHGAARGMARHATERRRVWLREKRVNLFAEAKMAGQDGTATPSKTEASRGKTAWSDRQPGAKPHSSSQRSGIADAVRGHP